MLRTLRACGVSARQLNTVLVIELVFFALVAGFLGMVGGYLMAAALLPDVAASLRGLYGAQIPGHLSLQPQWWIAGLLISVVGALLAATQSLWKASRLSVLAAAQPQAWHQAQRRWVFLQAIAALVVFVAAFGSFSGSAIRFWQVLPCWRRSARRCACVTLLLELALTGGQRQAHGALATWFWADSRQQLSGLSLALMALLLALSVNVGVGTMVETFSRTFIGWLDGRLAADLYLNASDDAQAKSHYRVAARAARRHRDPARRPGGHAIRRCAAGSFRPSGSCDLSRSLALAAIFRKCLGAACARRRRLSSASNWPRRMKLAIGDHDRSADPDRKLEDPGGRHLCRLRQSQGPDRRQFCGADPSLSKYPADADWLARRSLPPSRR